MQEIPLEFCGKTIRLSSGSSRFAVVLMNYRKRKVVKEVTRDLLELREVQR